MPCPFYQQGKIAQYTAETGGWMGPKDVVDVLDKRNIWSPFQEPNPLPAML
jgi:hypothetical protein